MDKVNLKFQEEYSAKLPALTLLTNLGWDFLPPDVALSYRDGKVDQVVFVKVLREVLASRTFHYAGNDYPLSQKSIDNLISELTSPALNEGLKAANERLYNHLLYGISITEFVAGKKLSPTISIIDWHHLEANQFHFTEEFSVTRANGFDTRRPDIVCFVNGLPLVVIEAKRPDGNALKGPTVQEGISQSIRNQRPGEIPHLFAYAQLLLSINGMDGRYGTIETPEKFWAAWREEDISDGEMAHIKNKAITGAALTNLFNHRPKQDLTWYQNLIAGGELTVSKQDKLIISLLSKDRLMDMVRFFTIFDKKVGKIVARYQQVFGIKRLLTRIAKIKPNGGREGGVIWHTTGSGKSFTMVFLSKALILHEGLKQCRIIVVTDRVDLETQLSKTFASGGELASKKDKEAAMATSGARLAEQIGKGNERIIFTLVQKFNSAMKQDDCYNPSRDIIILIDEGHRSQGGTNSVLMEKALPYASYIAFTGTPLLKDDKTTNKFGPIIHAYTMQRAVEDQTVTPLLYEERIPELNVNEKAIDAWFDKITKELSEEQKTDLKKKFGKKGQIYGADDRIRLIAFDIAQHFENYIQDGLKGQLCCDSKASAIKYKKYLLEAGFTGAEVVMSAPDTREGNTEVGEEGKPEVIKWWEENVPSGDEVTYTKQLVERFDKDPSLKILIVVDKLLTGFDEPKNTVLYIDKPLKGHNLIQAIARVNRLHPDKQFGLLIDYRGILRELDTTIQDYQDLAARTQGGYDIDDIKGLYQQMGSEYKRLPHLYKELWSTFDSVKNKSDIEALRSVLVPHMEMVDGQMVDTHLKRREDFYERLTNFARCLKVAMQSLSFFEDTAFTDKDRRTYKETLKQLTSLRQTVQMDCGETVRYDEYAAEVKKLLDKHVAGVTVRDPEGAIIVDELGKDKKPEDWSEDKTRNETDLIRTRVTKMIEQELRDDPYAQEAFSKLLLKAIEEAESLFEHPNKQYALFKDFEEKVKNRHLDDIPDAFHGNKHAQAYFGVFKKHLPEGFALQDQQVQDKWVKQAFHIDSIVDSAVAEHSINPQNIEAEIRKKLLPLMFNECKAIGAGSNQAKTMVEAIVQIVRVGLSEV